MFRARLRNAVIFVAVAGLAGCASSGGSAGGSAPTPAGPAATTTMLTVPSATANLGSVIPLTATVTTGGGTVLGTVSFYDNGILLQGGVRLTNGSATFPYGNASSGGHSFTASYDGSAMFQASTSGAASVTVSIATVTDLTVSSRSVSAGGTITMTATMMGTVSGTVTFYDGAVALGSSTITSGTSTAAFTTGPLSVGLHSLSARYDGDALHTPSSSSVIQVNAGTGASPTIVLTEATTSGYVWTGVTLTATLNATATGAVTFYSGTQYLGSATLAAGVGTLLVHPSGIGVDALTAVYSGDPSFLGATSNPVAYTVLASPLLTLSISATTVALGDSVTLTGTLNPATITGNVNFYDGYKLTDEGDGILNVPVVGPEISSVTAVNGIASLTTSGLSVGTHTLVAVFTTGETLISNRITLNVTRNSASCGLAPALYELTSGSASLASQSFAATALDQSAVCVANAGTTLTLSTPVLTVTGGASSLDNSHFFGLDAALLAYGASASSTSGGSISIPDSGSITTAAPGAGGVFATGNGAKVTASNLTVSTSGDSSQAVGASQAGVVTLNQATLTTLGTNSAVIATEFSGGTVSVTGGSAKATGANSPAVRAPGGSVTLTDVVASSAQESGAILDGTGSLVLSETKLTGALHGIFILNSNGLATSTYKVTVTKGAIEALTGDVFHIAGVESPTIALNGGTSLSAGAGKLINVLSGAKASVVAAAQQMSGDVACDADSNVTLSLTSGTSLTGSINSANTCKGILLQMDAGSTWNVAGTSYVSSIADPAISGSTVSNIVGNGFTVYYVSSANPSLNGATYALAGPAGGLLKPM